MNSSCSDILDLLLLSCEIFLAFLLNSIKMIHSSVTSVRGSGSIKILSLAPSGGEFWTILLLFVLQFQWKIPTHIQCEVFFHSQHLQPHLHTPTNKHHTHKHTHIYKHRHTTTHILTFSRISWFQIVQCSSAFFQQRDSLWPLALQTHSKYYHQIHLQAYFYHARYVSSCA